MPIGRLAGALLALGFVILCSWTSGCSGTSGAAASDAGIGSPNTGQGYCAASFNKACSKDDDCQTSSGERCCPYGSSGSICQLASTCPISCTNDTPCNTSAGEACATTSIETGASKSCQVPSTALSLCQSDTDCTGAGDVCCKIYNQGICEPSNSCPKTCASSADCTTQAPVCCTTVRTLEPALAAGITGLCLNPTSSNTGTGISTGTPCPKACTSSADCANQGQLCCQGICSDACPKTCTNDGDCQGVTAGGTSTPLCSFTYNVHPPAPPVVFRLGPSCQGTPAYSSCSECATNGCYCAGCTSPGTCLTTTTLSCAECGSYYSCSPLECPGCVAGDAGTGSCIGTAGLSATCAECPSSECGTYLCPGCTPTTGSCTGTSNYSGFTTCADCGSTYCGTSYCPGCILDSSSGTCSGSFTACSSFTNSTDCSTTNAYGCTWSGGCAGSITPCSALTDSTQCSETNAYGCTWSAGAVSCTGTATTCAQFTSASTCPTNTCEWSTSGGACSGTLTACSQLSTQTSCATQEGCYWE